MATILIATEDADLRVGLARALGEAHQVLELDSLDAARDALEAFAPDLVVTSTALPDGSGLQLCRLVRSRYGSGVGVAIVTEVDVEPMGALLAGADDVVSAPLSGEGLARLGRLLRRALASRRAARTRREPHVGAVADVSLAP